MVMASTEVAILIGGNSEPAYHLTVTALPSEIAATKNKRSAHLIQDFMQESLGIKSKRGVVRFDPIAEENLATNGVTALQEIEQLQRNSVEDEGVLRAFSRQTRRSKKSSMRFPGDGEKTPTPVSRSGTPSLFSSKCRSSKPLSFNGSQRSGKEAGEKKEKYISLFQKMKAGFEVNCMAKTLSCLNTHHVRMYGDSRLKCRGLASIPHQAMSIEWFLQLLLSATHSHVTSHSRT